MKLHNFLLVLGVTAAVMLATHWAGFWIMLGAHPWWSGTATWFGIGAGAVISALSFAIFPKSSRSTRWQAAAFFALALVSYGVAMFGKREFVGSFAEDAFAGRLWYLGFIAFCIAVYCTLAALARFGRWSRKDLD